MVEYMLVTDHKSFANISVWDTFHNTDHYMVLVYLHSTSFRGNWKPWSESAFYIQGDLQEGGDRCEHQLCQAKGGYSKDGPASGVLEFLAL